MPDCGDESQHEPHFHHLSGRSAMQQSTMSGVCGFLEFETGFMFKSGKRLSKVANELMDYTKGIHNEN